MAILDFIRRHTALCIGALILLLFIVIVFLTPIIVPDMGAALSTNVRMRLRPPSIIHPFGTDGLGRDVFARVIVGTRLALWVAVAVVGASAIIGIPLGLYAGFKNNAASSVIMRATDLFLAVPQLILALALTQVLRPSVETAIIALAVAYWPFFTRVVFSDTRKLSTLAFIEALQSMGAGPARILFLHLLPNCLPVIIVRSSVGMGYAVLSAAVLGFLGVGTPPPNPDWGVMVAESREFLPDGWWMAVFPGVAIMFLVLAFNLLGDGLQDIVNPRRERSTATPATQAEALA